MRIFHALFLLIPLILSSCKSPNEPTVRQWQPIAQLPNDVYYDEILFSDSHNGWVIGQSGRLLRTTDAGENWQSVNTGSSSDLHCIVFANKGTGWIGGRKNTILHTTDAGVTWVVQNVVTDTLHRILSMSFVDAQSGWAVSNFGEILHTSDAGTSWSYQQSGTQWALTSVHFADVTHGWAIAFNQIVCRTSDGGAHWETRQLTSSSPGWYTDINFADEQHGWIATTVALSSSIQPGSPLLYTEDGGINWTQQAILPSMDLNAISVAYPNFAWIAGDNKIFQTSDGGISWITQYQTDNQVFVSLSFINANNGWALGFSGSVFRYE